MVLVHRSRKKYTDRTELSVESIDCIAVVVNIIFLTAVQCAALVEAFVLLQGIPY